MVAVAGRFFGRANSRTRSLAQAGVGLLTLETIALTTVAFSKLNLYIGTFGLTRTRLAVAWFLGWLLGTLLILGKQALIQQSILRVFNISFPRLMSPVYAFACVVLILFGLSNPDHTVATANLNRTSDIVALDQGYLLRLSSDATPVIVENQDRFDNQPRQIGPSPFQTYCSEKRSHRIEFGLLGWNYGTAQARSTAIELCDPL